MPPVEPAMPADFIQATFGLLPAILLAIAIGAGILIPAFLQRQKLGWEIVTWAFCTVLPGVLGLIGWRLTRNYELYMGIRYASSILVLALSSMGLFLGIIELGLMRLLGFFRLGAISRITYYEAILQPF